MPELQANLPEYVQIGFNGTFQAPTINANPETS